MNKNITFPFRYTSHIYGNDNYSEDDPKIDVCERQLQLDYHIPAEEELRQEIIDGDYETILTFEIDRLENGKYTHKLVEVNGQKLC